MAGLLTSILEWINSWLGIIPQYLFQKFLEGASTVLGYLFSIPGLGFLNFTAYYSGIPNSVWWYLQWLRPDVAVNYLVTALIIRFIIRRLPFIG